MEEKSTAELQFNVCLSNYLIVLIDQLTINKSLNSAVYLLIYLNFEQLYVCFGSKNKSTHFETRVIRRHFSNTFSSVAVQTSQLKY